MFTSLSYIAEIFGILKIGLLEKTAIDILNFPL